MRSEIPAVDLLLMACRYSLLLFAAALLGGGLAEASGFMSVSAYATVAACCGVTAAALVLLGAVLVLARKAQRHSGWAEFPSCLAVDRARAGTPERGIRLSRKAGLLYGASHGEACEHRWTGCCIFPRVNVAPVRRTRARPAAQSAAINSVG